MFDKLKNLFGKKDASAWEEPPMIQPELGEDLDAYAIRIAAEAKEQGRVVRGTFNDVSFPVMPGVRPAFVLETYEDTKKKKDEAFAASPEGKKRAEERQRHQAQEQQRSEGLKRTSEALIARLDTLDFSDMEGVIDWVTEFQEPSDTVEFDREAVLKSFREHGFEPGANVGSAFDETDKENAARYVIGQGLKGIEQRGYVPQAIHGATSKWKERFGRDAEAEREHAAGLRRRIDQQ